MNIAELVINYHNAKTVFGNSQGSGICDPCINGNLKHQAYKEQLYYQTYSKKHQLSYETLTDGSVQSHAINLSECHLLFLVDNLLRRETQRVTG